MFFLHKKPFDTEKLVHTDCTQKFLQTDFFARRHFTQSSFYTAETFLHRSLCAQKTYAQQFLQTDGLYTQKILRTEVLHTEGFMHNNFYIRTLLHTDVFTQKLVHTARVYTQHTHSQFLHREVLLPLLNHLPFVSPLSSIHIYIYILLLLLLYYYYSLMPSCYLNCMEYMYRYDTRHFLMLQKSFWIRSLGVFWMKRGQHLWLQIMFHCPTMQLDDNPNWLVCILDHFGHVNWLVWSQPVSAVCRWEERFSCEFVREAGVPSVSWSSLVCLPAAEDHWSWPGFKWFILDMFLLPPKKSVSKETRGLVLNHFGVPGVPYWGYLMSLLFKIWSPFWGSSSGNAMAPSQGVKKVVSPGALAKTDHA